MRNRITLFAVSAVLVAFGSEAGTREFIHSVKKAQETHRTVKSRGMKHYAATAADAGALWCAKTQKAYGWNGMEWELMETYNNEYTSQGNIAVQTITDEEGGVSRTTNTWNDNNMLASRYSEFAEDAEAEFTPYTRLSREYDTRVTNFITLNNEEVWTGDEWSASNKYKQTLTRDDAGNVTLMERAVFFLGDFDPTERIAITYGADGKASTIEVSSLTYDYDNNDYAWETGDKFTNIVWEETDGQIVSADNLFEGSNRIKTADILIDDMEGTVEAEYHADGRYSLTMKVYDEEEGDDIVSTFNYTPLDEYGSCRIFTITDYIFMGDSYYTESYTETYNYDAYGLILLEEVQYTDGTYAEVIDRTEGVVEYDETYGYPLTWTISEFDYDENEMYETFRAEFSDYINVAGVENVSVDNIAPVYYNLQGVRIDNPAAGNIYIRRVGNNVDKVLIR